MDLINLEGLFGNDLIIYNIILKDYYNRILKISSFSSINCNIIFDKIYLKDSYNCQISIINQCLSSQSISLTIFLQTIIDNKELMSEKLKEKIQKYLGIDLNITAEKQKDKGFMKRCNISSSVSNIIEIKELLISNCTSAVPLNFLFYNTGDVNTNCGIVELINAIGKKENTDKTEITYDYYLNKVLNLNEKDIFIISIFIFIILIIIIILNSIFKKSTKIIHIKNFLLKNEK